MMPGNDQQNGFAIITPSYGGDHERCVLLCASIDRFVTGHAMHYLLVEDRDVALFRHLEGPRRKVIADSAILPGWLKPYPDPLRRDRRIWASFRTWPMRGWHVQQLRKLAIAKHIPEDILLHCDSDVVFVRSFDVSRLVDDEGRTRLYRLPDGITSDMTAIGHVGWVDNTARLLGIAKPAFPAPDYINNLITWSKPNILALHEHIEARSGRDWISAIGRNRSFSEAMIYGMFVDEVRGKAAGHFADEFALCMTLWFGETTSADDIDGFIAGLADGQVAIGLQSFINAPIKHLWSLLR
jgi:hypothetical protein